MSITTEKLILSSLIKNPDYTSHVISFIKDEYFSDKLEQELFKQIRSHIQEYNSCPNKSILLIDSNNNPNLNELESNETVAIINEITSYDEPSEYTWLVKQTEDFCRNRSMFINIMKAISIYDGTDKKTSPNVIPELMKESISITFDQSVGMDLFDDAEERFDYYNNVESKIPFNIDILNKITNGGVPRKTLNLIVSGINAGKTLSMCSFAADYMRSGLNVLYVSLEVAAVEIGKRIDSNLIDYDINEIQNYGKEKFLSKMDELKLKTIGGLKIKEYAAYSITSLVINNLIDDLLLKQNFKVDVLLIDYLTLMESYRLPQNSNGNTYLRSVASELRGIGVNRDLIVWSAAQLQRELQNTMDAELTNISEAIGISETADFMLLNVRSEELDEVGKVSSKQLKNRYGDKSINRRFTMGMDLNKQKLFNDPDYQSTEQKQTQEMKQLTQTNTTSKFAGLKI